MHTTLTSHFTRTASVLAIWALAVQAQNTVQSYAQTKQAPSWTVIYGQEFWREQSPQGRVDVKPNGAAASLPKSVDLGRLIERVSLAFTANGPNGSATAATKNYRACLDSNGLHFFPQVPTAANACPEEVSFSFRTLSLKHGPDSMAAPPSRREWTLTGNTAQALLSSELGVIEHYQTFPEGVAVTWVIAQKLSKRAPITIEAELTGLEYVGQSPEGIHFADANGTPRVRVGKVIAVDNAGHRWNIPVTKEGQGVRLEIPESILAQAVYPLGIDPIISAEFGIDIPLLAPAPSNQYSPAVASDGTNYLVVWMDDRANSASGFDIYGARVTGAGAVADPNGLIISAAYDMQSDPAVSFNGIDYVVVWEDGRNFLVSGTDIYGTRISTGGTVLDPNGINISSSRDGNEAHPAIASVSLGYGSYSLVVWDCPEPFFGATDTDIYGARVASNGQVQDPFPMRITQALHSQITPAVAASAGDFLVVWTDHRYSTPSVSDADIRAARVTGAGTVIGDLPISTASGDQTFPAVAANGEHYVVVWQDQRGADADIYAARLNQEGLGYDNIGLPISSATGSQLQPAITGGSDLYHDSFFVVWQDHRTASISGADIFGARVSYGSGMLDSGGIAICSAPATQVSPTVVGNANGYLVAWQDERNIGTSGQDIYATLVTTTGVVSNTAGFPVGTTLRLHEQHNPAVAFNGSNYLVVWEDTINDSSNRMDIYGLRLNAAGQVLDSAPIGIRIALGDQLKPAVASNGRDYLVVWEDYGSSRVSQILGARVSRAGILLDAQPLQLGVFRDSMGAYAPAVAGNRDRYLVAWEDTRDQFSSRSDIFGMLVERDGTLVNREGITISTAQGDQSQVAVASDGENYLVVWKDLRAGAGSEGQDSEDILGARVNFSGEIIDSDGFAIWPGGSMWPSSHPAVAFNGVQYLVVFETRFNIFRSGVGCLRVTPTGTVLGAPSNLGAPGMYPALPAVAASGCTWMSVWQTGQADYGRAWDVYGAAVFRNGSTLDSFGRPISSTLPDSTKPKIAAGNTGNFLVVSESLSGVISGNFVNLPMPCGLPITNLFNTGVNPSRMALVDSQPDPHYTLVNPAVEAAMSATAFGGAPVPPWMDDGDGYSTWITPGVNHFVSPGNFTYETRFDLTGLDPSQALITGQWATDDTGVDILINGQSVGATCASYSNFTPFQITTGFVPGTNTLAFVVNNAGTRPHEYSATGLRVEISGVAAARVVIISVIVSAGAATITWPSQPGNTYRVLYKNNLQDSTWTVLPGDVLASTGVSTKVDNTLSAATQRFYRIMLP